MAFIKVQKLVLDEDDKVSSGSAAIVETDNGQRCSTAQAVDGI